MRLLLLALIFSVSACSRVNFAIKNDVVGKTDKDFSNGTEISYRSDESVTGLGSFIPVPKIQESDPAKATSYVLKVEQKIYTPDDLDAHEVVEDENPYAGSLTLGERVIRATDTRRVSAEVRLGTSGEPSLAGATQKFVHDGLTDLGRKQQHPNGWDNQIEAEPLFNYDYERAAQDFRVKLFGLDFNNDRSTLLSLGNIHTAATISHGLRYGLNTPTATEANTKKINAYVFGDAYGQLQAHNLYYDGGIFRESVHTVDSKVGIYGFDIGAQVGYKSLIVRFTYTVESKQYDGAEDDFNKVGTLSFGTDW